MVSFAPGVRVPPDPLVVRFLDPMRRVVLVWLTLSRIMPITITSWYRAPASNVAAGGQSTSQHLLGTAIDGLSPGRSRDELLPFVQRAAHHFGVSAPAAASAGSGRSVHVQGLPFGMAAQILDADPGLLVRAGGFVGPPRRVA